MTFGAVTTLDHENNQLSPHEPLIVLTLFGVSGSLARLWVVGLCGTNGNTRKLGELKVALRNVIKTVI